MDNIHLCVDTKNYSIHNYYWNLNMLWNEHICWVWTFKIFNIFKISCSTHTQTEINKKTIKSTHLSMRWEDVNEQEDSCGEASFQSRAVGMQVSDEQPLASWWPTTISPTRIIMATLGLTERRKLWWKFLPEQGCRHAGLRWTVTSLRWGLGFSKTAMIEQARNQMTVCSWFLVGDFKARRAYRRLKKS